MALYLPSLLHQQTILSGRNRHYFFDMPTADLSIKTMSNGLALYDIEGARFAVEEDTYLILNEQQPYQITIESSSIVTSFCIFFPQGWAEQVWRGLHETTNTLLENPFASQASSVHFFERVRPRHEPIFSAVMALRDDLQQRVVESGELEERLRYLLAGMITTEYDFRDEAEKLSMLRANTRFELYRRLYRARDYMHAHLPQPLNLPEIAQVAYLSPYHFLRMFKQAFGQTPHAYLTLKRIERARFLLERTAVPITDICFDVGFESLGSFSSKFRQIVGLSPRQYRQQYARRAV
jgi:AraC family transcriptional regulator